MRSGIVLHAALLGALAAGCTGNPAPAPAPAAVTESTARHELDVLVFADTTSVRFEIGIPGANALDGAPVRATITPAAGGAPLWSGDLGALAVGSDGAARLVRRVDGLRPRLWSPQSPTLYRVVIEAAASEGAAADSVRFGFRSVRSENGRILLNGRPVFLRGNAINPPGRNVPDSLDENRRFARDYIRYLKGAGVNIIRLMRPSQVWFDVADEEGMMIFQGHYGTPKGGKATSPPTDIAASLDWYREEVLGPQINHPSVVIYALSNEQAAPEIGYLTTGHEEVARFLQTMYDSLHRWDDTRLYIGNAGYGFGRGGEICDIHRYWGWYYNSFLSFYTLRDPGICWRTSEPQPVTLTENTGNYTGVDGRFNLVSKTKQPASQLNWTGHAPPAQQARRALDYQAFVAKQAIEISRRIRARNPYVAGLMPFTILFHDWWAIGGFEDMRPKPVAEQYAVSYAPVLLSWEMWTPQVYAGATIRPVAHVVNDAESGEALTGLTLHWALLDSAGTTRSSGSMPLPDVAYYGAAGTPLRIDVPAELPAGTYALAGHLVRGADTLSRNETPLFVARPGFAGAAESLARRVLVYDARGETRRALGALGIAHREVTSLDGLEPGRDLLVIGARAWDAGIAARKDRLAAFVAAGGRILVLAQDPARFDVSWLPADVRLQTEELDHPLVYPGGRPFRNAMAVNPEPPDHPVLEGIDRDRLFLWSDPTEWDESRPGFPAVYPVTQGFVLTDRHDLARTAILANYDHGLEGIALAEMFERAGSVLLSGFGIVERVGLDPVAERMLVNLVRYGASAQAHHAHPLVDAPIAWGDYQSERGLLTGIYSGLLLNTVPVIPEGLAETYPIRIDEDGFHYAGGSGGWNSKPSVQYVPDGRRPFGPYEFSLGGSVRLPRQHAASGEGRFWCRIPAGRTHMLTTVLNPAGEPLSLEVEVNGVARTETIAPGATAEVSVPLAAGDTTLAVAYRGDRRLVLRRTEFR